MWFKRKNKEPEPPEQEIEFIIVEDDEERARREPGTVRGRPFTPSQAQVNIRTDR